MYCFLSPFIFSLCPSRLYVFVLCGDLPYNFLRNHIAHMLYLSLNLKALKPRCFPLHSLSALPHLPHLLHLNNFFLFLISHVLRYTYTNLHNDINEISQFQHTILRIIDVFSYHMRSKWDGNTSIDTLFTCIVWPFMVQLARSSDHWRWSGCSFFGASATLSCHC